MENPIEQKIAERVRQEAKAMQENNCPALDIGMFSQVMPKYLTFLELHRGLNTPPDEFAESLGWFVAVMITEFMVCTHPVGTNPKIIIEHINDIISQTTMSVMDGCGPHFGFKAKVHQPRLLDHNGTKLN